MICYNTIQNSQPCFTGLLSSCADATEELGYENVMV